jgi:hypothetical protein
MQNGTECPRYSRFLKFLTKINRVLKYTGGHSFRTKRLLNIRYMKDVFTQFGFDEQAIIFVKQASLEKDKFKLVCKLQHFSFIISVFFS